MSWWNIIKQNPYKEAGLSYQEDIFQQPRKGSQTTFPHDSTPQPFTGSNIVNLPTNYDEDSFQQDIQNKPIRQLGQKTIDQFREDTTQTVQDTATATALESQAQELEQQQLSDDAASDVGEVISRIKQQLARPPQGAKGVKALPIVEKLITATQTPTDFRDSVKEVVRELKLLEPTAV